MFPESEQKIPQCLKVAEVGKALSVSRATVYRLMEQGKLPYVRVGTTRRVLAASLVKYLEANSVGRN